MNKKEIEKIIEDAWGKKEQINKDVDKKIIDVINQSPLSFHIILSLTGVVLNGVIFILIF